MIESLDCVGDVGMCSTGQEQITLVQALHAQTRLSDEKPSVLHRIQALHRAGLARHIRCEQQLAITAT